MKKVINKGDRVRVVIPDDEIAAARVNGDVMIPILATRYNGMETTVSKKRTFYNGRGAAAGSIYEIEGAVSKPGIYYSFIADWLEVIECGQ